MPDRPRQPCTTPGCPGRAPIGRCPHCHTTRDTNPRTRDQKTAERGYNSAWRARRRDYLTAHPYCQLCGRLATVADHHPTSRRQLITQGDPDPDHDRHLRPLCDTCHNRQTAQHQPGGWWGQTIP